MVVFLVVFCVWFVVLVIRRSLFFEVFGRFFRRVLFFMYFFVVYSGGVVEIGVGLFVFLGD